MTLDSDILIDRRRLRRRLTVWRVLAILAIVAAIAFAAARGDREPLSAFGSDHIARVTVSGFIGDSRKRHELLEKLRKDSHVKAVIVSVDSPGGTTVGGEALYLDLRELAKEKPVAAVFGTVAASAAYLGRDRDRLHRRARQHDHGFGRRYLPMGRGERFAFQTRRQSG